MSTDIKNKEVLKQIQTLIKDLGDKDEFQRQLIVKLLHNVLVEHNTGVKLNIDKSLYDWIDAEARLQMKNDNK